MIFTEEFIEAFKNDPTEGVFNLDRTVRQAWKEAETTPGNWNKAEHEIAIETYALLVELADANLIEPGPEFEIIGSTKDDCGEVSNFLRSLTARYEGAKRERALEQLRNRFKAGIGKAFGYEFSQGDLERVQILINELRQLISSTAGFEQSHQRRLLLRLERLQAEMHKKVSDLDHLWGLVGDEGVVMAKLGKDAKPIVDRIRELAGITWNTQARAEELPSGTSLPQLGNDMSQDGS